MAFASDIERAFAMAAIVTACDRSPPPPPEERAPVNAASVARALGEDAAAIVAPVDPATPAGDFRSDVAHFTTIESCASERAALDPLVGDALASIGYDTFLRDACRVMDAAKAKDPRRCAPIESSALRARCETVVAMWSLSPDRCPLEIEGAPLGGRAATCVAAASQDVRLCRAERAARRPSCEALVSRDVRPCAPLVEAEKIACERDVARWRTTLLAPSGVRPLPPSRLHLEVHGADGSPDPASTAADLDDDVERGVVLAHDPFGVRVRVGALQELGTIPHTVGPTRRVRIAFELLFTSAAATPKVDHFEIDVPGALTLVTPGVRASFTASAPKLERTRGGEARFVVDGVIGVSPRAYRVHADVTTFVRDLVGVSP